jgi:ribosomal-protein-alanine N-acetyltransferase
VIREGKPEDCERIGLIQGASPGASQWDPGAYLGYRLLVAEVFGNLAGFLVWRQVCDDEAEILNMAVAPEYRRTGLAMKLFEKAREQFNGAWYLEVRESNEAARKLYEKMGFTETGRIREYYQFPPEGAVVMKLHSC